MSITSSMIAPSAVCRLLLRAVVAAAALTASFVQAACPTGDLNGDCVVDIHDLVTLADHWLSDCKGPACGDIDLDGRVNMNDLAVIAAQWHDGSSPLMITEFMASNSSTIADADGDFSDWIEIRNVSAAPVDLDGWYLTDNLRNLTKWAFPSMHLGSGEYLLVFASGKDRRDPAGGLHTNFSLARTGESLAITNPDRGIGHEYPDPYPPQLPDISYGMIENAIKARLIEEGDPIRYHVPTDDSLGDEWRYADFDDSWWGAGWSPVGYDRRSGPRPPVNLVGYWTFDDDLLDHSGNGNHAAPRGTTFSSDIPPTMVSGKSISFNGLSDYLQVPDSPSLNMTTGVGQPFTVAFWFKTTETQAKVVLEKGSRKHFVTRMEAFANSGKISFRMQEDARMQVISRDPVNDGQWHHFLASFDGTMLRLYIDGVLNGEIAETGHPENSDPLVIGSRFGAAPWNGRMDDLAIWNVALNQRQIDGLSDGSIRPLEIGQAISISDERLAGYWNFNGNLDDVSEQGHNAANFGAVYSTDVPPAIGQGTSLRFNGVNNYVVIPDDPRLRIGSKFTLSLWMKSNNLNQTHKYLLSRHGSGHQQAIIYEYVDNHVEFFGPSATGSDPRPGSQMLVGDTNWRHVAYTYDGATWSGYVDGTRIFSVQRSFVLHTGAYPWYIGSANGSVAFFDGWIDDVSIWTDALSEREVAALAAGVSPRAISGYGGLIRTDIEPAMYGRNASVYIRHTFHTLAAEELEDLRLDVKYDDGFIAYLNGIELARRNAPSGAAWNAAATAERPDEQAVVFEEIDVSRFLNALRPGKNILSVHGLNYAAVDEDFLWSCRLTATQPWHSSQKYRYFSQPTPGGPNGESAKDIGPVIHSVSAPPPAPANSDDIVVSASIMESFFPVDSVRLVYRVMYGPQVAVEMRDDGVHPDQTAGDGTFTGVIPASAHAPGQMVRWYIQAVDAQQNPSRWPIFNNPTGSPEYLGTVVHDPQVSSNIPIFHWFLEPGTEQAARTRAGTRCSLYYDGLFYDNIFVRLRGATAAGLDKNPYKFEFNKGFDFVYDPDMLPIDEFDLNTTYRDKAYIRPILAFELYRDAGVPYSSVLPVHMRRNNAFFSVAIFTEHPDRNYLRKNGLDPDGATYKANLNGFTVDAQGSYFNVYTGFDKKNPKDGDSSEIVEFVYGLDQSGDAQTRFVLDTVDIPSIVNYMAASVIIQDVDRLVTNFFAYRDVPGTGEWTMLPWDLDLSLGQAINSSDQMFSTHDNPHGPSHPFYGAQNYADWRNPYLWNKMIDVFCNTPVFREMYVRRLRTLMDRFLMPAGTPAEELYFERRIEELYELMGPDVLLDKAKWASWGQSQTFRQAVDRIINDYLAPRRTHLYVNHSVDRVPLNPGAAGIPHGQVGSPVIDFEAVDCNPLSGNQDEEYIQLINKNGVSVDISGWRMVGEVEHTFKPGVVLPAGGAVYVSPNVRAFRGRETGPSGGQGLFVQGNYRGRLANRGGVIELLDEDLNLVSTTTYEGNPSRQQEYLRITELMYHPRAGGDYYKEEYEFVELKNIGEEPLSLAGVRFSDGISYEFGDLVVGPHGLVVVATNLEAFWERCEVPDGVEVVGPYEGRLSNSGENVRLEDAGGDVILEFEYDDDWYPSTDGEGYSLNIVDPYGTPYHMWGSKSSWRASSVVDGTPGMDD